MKKHDTGECYTPTALVNKLTEKAEQLWPLYRYTHLVWDPACGPCALTRDFEYTDLIQTTLYEDQIDREANPAAIKCQLDFTSDTPIPETISEKLKSEKPLLFICNPPYIKVKDTHWAKEMHKGGITNAASAVYQFLYRFIQIFNTRNNPKDKILFISPQRIYRSERNEKLTQYIRANLKFVYGTMIPADLFDGLCQWPIACMYFERGTTTEDFKVDVWNHDLETMGQLWMPVITNKQRCNKWIRELPESKIKQVTDVFLTSACRYKIRPERLAAADVLITGGNTTADIGKLKTLCSHDIASVNHGSVSTFVCNENSMQGCAQDTMSLNGDYTRLSCNGIKIGTFVCGKNTASGCAKNTTILNGEFNDIPHNFIKIGVLENKGNDISQCSSGSGMLTHSYDNSHESYIGTLVANKNSCMGVNKDTLLLTHSWSEQKTEGPSIAINDQYARCISLFCARSLTDYKWYMDSDEYHIPNLKHPKYAEWLSDCVILSLVHNKSQQSSLRNIPSKYTPYILNQWHWLNPESMPDLSVCPSVKADFDLYRGPRYVADILSTLPLSIEAQAVYDALQQLVVDCLPLREEAIKRNPEYHLQSWDMGFAQYKYMLKAIDKRHPLLNPVLTATTRLITKMKPLVFELGFLKQTFTSYE